MLQHSQKHYRVRRHRRRRVDCHLGETHASEGQSVAVNVTETVSILVISALRLGR